MSSKQRLVQIGDFRPLIGDDAVDRIREKAAKLKDVRVVHVNSTYYGGGVAELLSSLTLLMSSAGIKTEWRAIHGPPDFFSITKKMHNALQGAEINLTDLKKSIYEEVVFENAVRNQLDHDFVIVHDPQPVPLILHYRKHGPWIWQCHVDLTSPNRELWEYLVPFIEPYDAVIVSLPEYAQQLRPPQLFFKPAINPFTITNRDLSDAEIEGRLAHYDIRTDLPLVVQVSRFDRWKDPEGVIAAAEQAMQKTPLRLVLLGNVATDDPEGDEVFRSLLKHRSDRVSILSCQDSALVNALQRRATVVVQKSIREGFGLTVAEAMWKRAAVVGGNVGGIRHQIEDGVNGFLVSSVDEAAERIVDLIQSPDLRVRLGAVARQTVQREFLMTRLLEQYLDLFNSFETTYCLRSNSSSG